VTCPLSRKAVFGRFEANAIGVPFESAAARTTEISGTVPIWATYGPPAAILRPLEATHDPRCATKRERPRHLVEGPFFEVARGRFELPTKGL
jgi:hypothetical protein